MEKRRATGDEGLEKEGLQEMKGWKVKGNSRRRVRKRRAAGEEGLEREGYRKRRVGRGRTTGDGGLGNGELLQRDGYQKRDYYHSL